MAPGSSQFSTLSCSRLNVLAAAQPWHSTGLGTCELKDIRTPHPAAPVPRAVLRPQTTSLPVPAAAMETDRQKLLACLPGEGLCGATTHPFDLLR